MIQPLRRVHLVVRPAAGGMRQHVLNLLAEWDYSRYTPSLAAPEEFLNSLPSHPHVPAFPLAIAPRFAFAADIRAAKRLAGLAAPSDIVHAHGLRAAWVAALAGLYSKFPIVVTAHNLVPKGHATGMALRLIGRRSVRLIAVSEPIADGLSAHGVLRAKIVIIPNGINICHFAQGPERVTAREFFGASQDAFVVSCIARLSHEKGVDVLVRAASELPEIQVLIAGEGPDHAALSVNLPQNVRLLGRIEDTRILLWASDIIAVPSRLEGQGIVALESMASGVPVVASRVGGLAEMLTDGKTALLVPPNDFAALADALRRLFLDGSLRRHLAHEAGLLVRKEYGLTKMVRAVEAVYGEIGKHSPN